MIVLFCGLFFVVVVFSGIFYPPLLCARDLQSFFDLTPSVLFGRPEKEIPGGGVRGMEKYFLFAFDQISFCVERVALRLRLVLPVVVFIT